ncbi:TolC family protein [Telmatocola sphagniphila]|uniref:TolC family protein n=1 Tax=Telmatocola sphagniphila TaxID=1123043 RepID=A0A8E6BBI3_9BACT|nr:TolC family protein [Telmatocola sphagniphila]QVL34701.1 TolC family protein [Telmatocola sphagniphila]
MKLNRLRVLSFFVSLGLTMPLVAENPPQEPAKKNEAPKPSKDSLEDYLSRGLRNNADITVAEVKLLSAAADLQKVKQTIISDVSAAYFKVLTAKKQLEYYEAELSGVMKQPTPAKDIEIAKCKAQVVIAQEALRGAQATLDALVADKQTMGNLVGESVRENLIINYLSTNLQGNSMNSPLNGRQTNIAMDSKGQPIQSALAEIETKSIKSELSENQLKILGLFSTPVQDMNPEKGERTLAELWDNFPVAIKEQIKLRSAPNFLSTSLVPPKGVITLAAWLEWVEDSMENNHVFVIREYGLFLMPTQEKFSTDTILATKAWKQYKHLKDSSPKK